MANRYYPEFYLRKRQREAVYKRITWGMGVLAFIAAGVFTGFLIYKNVVEPRQTQPGATPEAAETRTILNTQQRLAGLENQPVVDSEQADSQLASAAPALNELPYEQSLPSVQVSVSAGGMVPPGTTPATDATAGTDPQQVPADAAAPPQDASAVQPQAPADPAPPEAAKPAAAPEEKKPAAQEKPKEKPKPEVKEKPQEKPKEPAKPAEPEQAKPAGKSTFVYRVYAGSYASEEAAQSNRDELKSLGLNGSVNKSGGEYNVFVAELTDLAAATALVNKLKNSGFGAAFASRKKN